MTILCLLSLGRNAFSFCYVSLPTQMAIFFLWLLEKNEYLKYRLKRTCIYVKLETVFFNVAQYLHTLFFFTLTFAK